MTNLQRLQKKSIEKFNEKVSPFIDEYMAAEIRSQILGCVRQAWEQGVKDSVEALPEEDKDAHANCSPCYCKSKDANEYREEAKTNINKLLE